MKKAGLIGFPLKNSFSETYFNERFSKLRMDEYVYQNYPIADINELPALLKQTPELFGFNVTIPHKQSIIPLLDELDETAAGVGAVNCVKRTGDKLKGYNTDVYGFEQTILPYLQKVHQALILGTGGAAKAVAYVLRKHKIPFVYVSRGPQHDAIGYSDLTEQILSTHQLIINCTPLGMFPNTESFPEIPFQWVMPEHIAYDLIYLPEQTEFLKRCKQRGATTRNGLNMLHLQADKSWEIWNLNPA
jgi:shikimate dehydrogenase